MFEPEVNHGKILNDIVIFTPSVNYDERGSIFSSFSNEFYKTFLPENISFNHDKFAESKFNVLRGLHGDTKTWKLISCVYGEIYEVVADMRENSKNYLKWEGFELSGKNKKQILVPPNFVNGYYVLSDFAVFHYKLAYEGEYFDVADQKVVKWNDERLNINWPFKQPVLQSRDK